LYREKGEAGKADEVLAQVADLPTADETAAAASAASLDLEIPPDMEPPGAPAPAAAGESEGIEIEFPEDDFITGPEVELPPPAEEAPPEEPGIEVAGAEELLPEEPGIEVAGAEELLPEEPKPAAIEEEIEFDVDEPSPEPPGVELELPPEEPVPPPADEGISVGESVADLEGLAEGPEPAAAPEVEEDLDEAEFYLQQGLRDEAIGIYQKILSVSPNEPRALAQLQKLQAEGAEPPEAPEAPAEAEAPASGMDEFNLADSGEEEAEAEAKEYLGESSEEFFEARDEIEEGMFDLAEQLEDELGEVAEEAPEEGPSFEDIFSEFKKGVEREISEDDTQAHYDLGIAYKEMGLTDDAIQEFTLAAAEKERTADCFNMIGLCYTEKGMVEEAIQSYIKGLKSPSISKTGAIELSYELGVAYQSIGKAAEALKVFERINRSDPDFRDVQERIAELKGGAGAAPEEAAEEPREAEPEPEAAEAPPAEASEEKEKSAEKVRQRKISFV